MMTAKLYIEMQLAPKLELELELESRAQTKHYYYWPAKPSLLLLSLLSARATARPGATWKPTGAERDAAASRRD